MANFHDDDWIMDKVQKHYQEAKELIAEEQIFGIFLQGSQNYGLDTPQSDVDTKLIVIPTFDDIVRNRKPISTTHIRENDEHIDIKDVRLFFNLFLKQNMNILEVLFTPYCILNKKYTEDWLRLIIHKEEIARYCPFLNIKAMKGVALEKYHALEHRYPSKANLIDTIGYDPKQLHHLLRLAEWINRFTLGVSYENCLEAPSADYLKGVKEGMYSLEKARSKATAALNYITKNADTFAEKHPKEERNEKVEELLYEVQYNILKKSILNEVNK